MVAIGDLLDASELLFCDIFACTLTLFWDNAVGCLVAGPLPACDCWYDGACGDDFVGFEALDLGDSLGVGGVAGGVDDEEVVGCLFGDDTTIIKSICGPRNVEGTRKGANLPLDNFLVQVLETLLHFGNIDIFPPGLLALSRWLTVLLRGVWIARLASENGHFDEW